jgi:hypothetical protein
MMRLLNSELDRVREELHKIREQLDQQKPQLLSVEEYIKKLG